MKTLILTAVLLCYQQNVFAVPVLDIITSKLNEFASIVASAFKNLKNKVKIFIANIGGSRTTRKPEAYNLRRRPKKEYCDFVAETAAEVKTKSPEHIKLRSEPTAFMSTPQLAMLHGNTMESHVVLTKDGYLLTLHRITNMPREKNSITLINQTVLLHHGLLGSSADWILLGSKKSLPYILSAVGYDVWMLNARGNYYSRGHKFKNIESLEYWRFSWQEMGEYDLPAVIDYINDVKNSSHPINFIGHSMGATALLVLLSTAPHYNKLLRMGILLAPLAYMANSKGPMKMLTPLATRPPQPLLKVLGFGEFLPDGKIPLWMSNRYCNGKEIYCNNPLLFLTGIPSVEGWDEGLVARILYHVPAGGSTGTIFHYAQLMASGKFHKFGVSGEEFPLNHVTLPIVLFSSSEDSLATLTDVLNLYFNIASPIDHYIIREQNFTHTDFVWGPNAHELVFAKVVDFLENGLNFNRTQTNEI